MNAQKTLLLVGASLLTLTSTSFAQAGGDPTTPPAGVPGKVMKTLDEVEARIPLVDGASGVTQNLNTGFSITLPGSYYLVHNISVSEGTAININSDNVTLDLNGFRIYGTGTADGSRYAIDTGTRSNVLIKNGTIKCNFAIAIDGGSLDGSSFDAGIYSEVFFGLGDGEGIIVKNVIIDGVAGNGIVNATLVEDSIVSNVDGIGIESQVIKNSIANRCEDIALKGDSIFDSEGYSLGNSGISATDKVINSKGRSISIGANSHAGIRLNSNGVVRSSSGYAESGSGIFLDEGTVSESIGFSETYIGIYVNDGTVSHSKGHSESTNDSSVARGIWVRDGHVSHSFGSGKVVPGITTDVASYCYGDIQDVSGAAIVATVAIACQVSSDDSVSATTKALGTP